MELFRMDHQKQLTKLLIFILKGKVEVEENLYFFDLKVPFS